VSGVAAAPALAGVKVVDVTHVLAGPFCTMLLGDMGAEVIKVENPEHGDHARAWPPFWNGVSSHFLAVNRNKRSITVNLKHRRGAEIVGRLAAGADVLVENLRTGTADRLGIGYAALSRRNPRLIYGSISGFGRTGPMAAQPGYDLIVQAYAGLMSTTGEPAGAPVRTGYSVVDLFTGLMAYAAIVTALQQRERTGRGQLVETSLLESTVALMSYHAVGHLATGQVPGRMGSAHPSLVPYQAFAASDGPFIVGCNNDRTWVRLCAALGREELAHDPRFATNGDRVRNRAELVAILEAHFRHGTVERWVAKIGAAGVPCSPVQDVAQVVADRQVAARGMLAEIPHPLIPGLRVPACAMKLGDSPAVSAQPPPGVGEHTEQVLAELGYGPDEIEELRRNGVV
jgi:crotonobetainyl-CoA:carnitine CoA-transferase CaiB-like acyl-CoA transferase